MQNLSGAKEPIWITYTNDDGRVKSAPLEVFPKIATKRGWKPKPMEWIR